MTWDLQQRKVNILKSPASEERWDCEFKLDLAGVKKRFDVSPSKSGTERRRRFKCGGIKTLVLL